MAAMALGALLHESARQPANPPQALTRDQASMFAKLALRGLVREFPNKPEHVLNDATDARTPKSLHPAFFGCYDWHSSVHGHWMLARLLRRFPDLPEAADIRKAMSNTLTAENLKIEAEYFKQPNRQSFERMFGWAWLLKLAEELHDWDDADAVTWRRNLQPVVDVIVARYQSFLPKQTYPIRSGVHPNTAFGLAFAFDYAQAVGHKELSKLIVDRSRSYYFNDADVPASWEPSGADFLSPSLVEADLMRRILTQEEFHAWFRRFLPSATKSQPKALFQPAIVTDRSDPQLVHLDGLNLSRAWCMRGISDSSPDGHPLKTALLDAANQHTQAALPHVSSNDYAGEHWLASFAVYLLTTNR